MEVKYIIETRYANGDSFADKSDTLAEVVEFIQFLESPSNLAQPDDQRLLATQLSVTTEEQ